MAGDPDPAWLDGLTSIILNGGLERDWAKLSADPRAAAERAARTVGPLIYGNSARDDEIRGAPWGESR